MIYKRRDTFNKYTVFQIKSIIDADYKVKDMTICELLCYIESYYAMIQFLKVLTYPLLIMNYIPFCVEYLIKYMNIIFIIINLVFIAYIFCYISCFFNYGSNFIYLAIQRQYVDNISIFSIQSTMHIYKDFFDKIKY